MDVQLRNVLEDGVIRNQLNAEDECRRGNPAIGRSPISARYEAAWLGLREA